jgi:hypothetical protein
MAWSFFNAISEVVTQKNLTDKKKPKRMRKMEEFIVINQKINEVIKAFAYGETPEQVAEAEDISAEAAKQVQREYVDDIAEEKTMLQEAGYLK